MLIARYCFAVAVAAATAFAALADAPTPIRRWDFEEGRWHLAKNSAPVFPGRLGPSGGPLGSLTIPCTTVYGMDFPSCYEPQEPDAAQPTWTVGRTHGFDALRLGTRKDGPYGSGITGSEFTNAFTFVGWVRLHVTPDGIGSATILRMGDAWNTGFRIRAEVAKWCLDGRLEARFTQPNEPNGAKRRIDAVAKGFAPGAWHFFAVVWNGTTLRVDVDGHETASVPMAEPFVPVPFPDSQWTGVSPFFENASKVRHLRFSIGGPSTTALDVDEISLFDRVLSADELAAVRGVLAAGTAEEQAADAVAQDAALERAKRITLEIPRGTGGYFRIGEEIAATALVPADAGFSDGSQFTASFVFSTLDGKALETRKRGFSVGETVREAFRPPRCGVYYLDMEIRDSAGLAVKKYDEPWCIGVVPPKPSSIDSPFGYWATEDFFSHDSNLRRLACSGTNELLTVRQVRIFREKQRIPADELRLFSWLTVLNTKEKAISDEQLAKLRDETWPKQLALMKRVGCREFEFTSEQDHGVSPEAYLQQLSVLAPMVRKAIPDAVLYPGGGTPVNGVGWTERIFSLGGAALVDGASIHAYSGNPLSGWHRGCSGTKFRDAIHAVVPDMPLYCTEVGETSLPRIEGRPMTRLEADRAPYRSTPGDVVIYQTSMPTFTEEECAAMSCQSALVTLALGYRTYVQCQHSVQGALPGLPSVARTALSGQVLNHMKGAPKMLPLATLRSGAVLVERKDGSNVLAVFGTANESVSFLAPPKAKFLTMDMYGNYGEIEIPADGLFMLTARLAPVYIFDVPPSFAPVAPLRFDVPDVVPASGELVGALCATNPFSAPLKGALAVERVRGARIELGANALCLAPGAATNIVLRMDGRAVKRGPFTLRVTLGRDGGAMPLLAERIVRSEGAVHDVPRLPDSFPLDGDSAKWDGVAALVANDEGDVSLGKPDPACPWLPHWMGQDDLALRVRVGWCADGTVRFLLETTDDVLMPAPEGMVGESFKWDCLELFVDTRVKGMLGSPRKTRGADQILVVPSVGDKAAQCAVRYPGGDERAVDVDCVGRRTGNGWLIEGRIAARVEGGFGRLGSQRLIALDFLVDDRDAADVPRKSAMAIHGHVGNNSDIKAWGRYKLNREMKAETSNETGRWGKL